MDLVTMHGNLNARRYIDVILCPHVIPFLHYQGPGVTFQHDNARPHTALITRQFLAQNNVDVLPRPTVFPYLNPIEHVGEPGKSSDRHIARSANSLDPRMASIVSRTLTQCDGEFWPL